MREDEIRGILADVCKELDWRAAALRCAAPAMLGASLLVACGGEAVPEYAGPPAGEGGSAGIAYVGGNQHGKGGAKEGTGGIDGHPVAVYAAPVAAGGNGAAGANGHAGGSKHGNAGGSTAHAGGGHAGGADHHDSGLVAAGGKHDPGVGGSHHEAGPGGGGKHDVDSGAIGVYSAPVYDSGPIAKYAGPEFDSGPVARYMGPLIDSGAQPDYFAPQGPQDDHG